MATKKQVTAATPMRGRYPDQLFAGCLLHHGALMALTRGNEERWNDLARLDAAGRQHLAQGMLQDMRKAEASETERDCCEVMLKALSELEAYYAIERMRKAVRHG